MSTRKDKLEKNILPVWEEISSKIKSVSTVGLSTADRDEIAHFKKVFAYIYEMLKSIDPDFIPIRAIESTLSPLQNISNYLDAYLSSLNINYIININDDYLDTLLRDLMPFFFYKGNISSSLKKSLNEYSEVVSEHTNSYLSKVKETSNVAENILNNLESVSRDLTKRQERFSEFTNDIFENNGIKDKIYELVKDFSEKNENMNKLYQNIFDEDNGMAIEIKNYLSDGKNQNKELHDLKNNSSQIIDELTEFHESVFGTKDKNGELKGGLKNELLERKSELDKFKIEQQKRYSELNTQIESLLPGATSAGLSSAYRSMHDKFSKEVKDYGMYFYISISILLAIIVIVNIPSISSYISSLFQYDVSKDSIIDSLKVIIPYGIFTLDGKELSLGNKAISILDSLIYKLPFILPAIWVALFVSGRRNEAQRLAQEYAHKEALAKSYESYKQQIEKLSEVEQNKLLPVLMEIMLKAIALNPAETLDKNHKEPTPIEEVIKKKEFWDFIEKIKSLVPMKKA